MVAATRSVTVTEIIYPAGTPIAALPNYRHQLLYPLNAIAIVRSTAGSSIVPLGCAAWIVPSLGHEIHLVGGGKLLAAFIEPTASRDLPANNCVIELTPLLQALISSIVSLPKTAKSDAREARSLGLLLDELAAPPIPSLHLSMPSDRRLVSICTTIMADPASSDTAAACAARIGITPKTLHLLFRQKTGLTFVRWRQRARLFQAIELLTIGAPVAVASKTCGYASANTLAAVFRKHFKMPPSAFRALARNAAGSEEPVEHKHRVAFRSVHIVQR